MEVTELRAIMRIFEELSRETQIPASAKGAYLVAAMQRPGSIRHLSDLLKVDIKTAIKLCGSLEEGGWLTLREEGRRIRPEPVVPRNVESRLATEMKSLIFLSPFKGEAISRAFADWIVAPTVTLVYGARPAFLTNPSTGQSLELDIYAPQHRWAIEYQGDQHFGPTSQYPGDKQFADRYRRDIHKAHLCRQNNIRLTTLTRYDLTLERVLEFMPKDVPRRSFDPQGPYVLMLEALGKDVAGRAERDRE